MDNILSSINEIYSDILRKKIVVLEQDRKPHFFGGASCKMGGGPDGHSSFKPKSWEVNRAWDIMGLEGTSVYSLDNGEVVSVNLKNYNPETKEYGYSITINTGTDKIYYTHLSSVGPNVKQGQKISQGDFIGKIGKPKEDPNWPSHVHVALEKGNLSGLMDGYCNLSPKKGSSSSTKDTSSSSATTDSSGFIYGNKSFADMFLPDNIKNFSVNEAVMLAPVPIKSGFKGNFNQVRAKGYIHPGTDIPVPSGTAVKAPLSGKVVGVKANQHPCGGTIDIQYSDGFWSRFCHMKQINVKEGDVVNRGDVVGLSGGGSNDYGRGRSSGPHLHFTLKKDGRKVDPAHYMEKFNASDLTFDKSDLNQTSSTDSDEIEGEVDYSSAIKSLNSPNNTSSSSSGVKTLYGNNDFANFMAKSLNINLENEIKEERVYDDFGKFPQSRYGSITLPKEKNEKIKSPVEGTIVSGKYNPSCINQISISHKVYKKDFILEYCGISRPNVRKGNGVSKGSVLGRTNEDVTISLFDESGSRVYIDSYIKAEVEKTKEEERKKGSSPKPKFLYDNPWGQILGTILASPFTAFEDKYDESGKLIQKRSSSPTEKNQVDDWLSKGSPTYSKKVNEEIKRIKKML